MRNFAVTTLSVLVAVSTAATLVACSFDVPLGEINGKTEAEVGSAKRTRDKNAEPSAEETDGDGENEAPRRPRTSGADGGTWDGGSDAGTSSSGWGGGFDAGTSSSGWGGGSDAGTSSSGWGGGDAGWD